MASEVDICNLSLSHLGDEALVTAINPPDGSVQAAHCKRFYPIARDALLEMHTWGFATKRAALQTVAVDSQPGQWGFAYALPGDCLSPKQVFLPGASTDAEGEDFLVEADTDGSKVLFTNAEDAVLRYVAKVSDPTKFTPLFVNAFSRLLASYLAGPLVKGKAGMSLASGQLDHFFKVDYPLAAGADANAQKRSEYKDFTPSSIEARQ